MEKRRVVTYVPIMLREGRSSADQTVLVCCFETPCGWSWLTEWFGELGAEVDCVQRMIDLAADGKHIFVTWIGSSCDRTQQEQSCNVKLASLHVIGVLLKTIGA